MIKNKPITIRPRNGQYTTKLVYWKDEPGKPKTEMNANFYAPSKEEVEKMVQDFIAEQEK